MKLKSLFLLALASLNAWAATGSYEITIPDGKDYPIAWSFVASTVSSAFPTAWAGTTLYFWDASVQNWVTVGWDDLDEEWSVGWDRAINNGEGFFWRNQSGAERTITVSGTLITATNVTRSFTAGKYYLIADPFFRTLGGNGDCFLECVWRTDTGWDQYTKYNLGYSAAFGDIVGTWNPSTQDMLWGIRTSNTACGFAPFWRKLTGYVTDCDQAWGSWTSPMVYPGRGFWLKPASNVTWTEPLTQVSCDP